MVPFRKVVMSKLKLPVVVEVTNTGSCRTKPSPTMSLGRSAAGLGGPFTEKLAEQSRMLV